MSLNRNVTLAGVLALAACAELRPRPTPQPQLAELVWEAQPDPAELTEAYPAAARAVRMSAIATLHCTATADGRLDACRATASPETYGFAEAAQAMARRYRLRPTDAAGARVAGRSVRVAVRFAPPPADIPAPSMPAANWRLAEGYTAAHFDRFYPDRAREGEVHGRATIQCTITAAGTLADCVVVQETPTFYGFGMAAIQIATRLYRVETTLPDGTSTVGGTARRTLVFQLAG
jgi:TonB family protein